MTTITKERLLKIQHWRETYGADSNVMLPAEEAAELARIALASLEAEKGADPVVFTDERNLRHIASGRETSLIWGKQNQEVGDIPLYRHAQPVPVDKEFIPKNLDKALGVVGVALPESKEEFNFQIERWIQRLIDRVIRYADEFKEQPVPVVPDDISGIIERFQYQADHLSEWHHIDEHSCKVNRRDLMTALEFMDSCRAAMLNGGKS
ncbi:Eaa protein [Salmonella enterica subsp. enterica serovar Anatum]|nr:Eaa protein [Salmonella enterica subsp. enterica serovar Typhimurium str. UK-1]EBV1744676.1 Eaa protein [Salmonella enterica subsp. enterica serovar Anatum]ECV5769251.1 RNA methyltransferase [Salmonella enterica subsp. enterica serovar Typhimurium]EEJ7184927.1 RNA methyltransferase [Salmonella enterica subsp. enterica]EBV4199279.1 Eaa protein [Salmonella enterica subsp. enterica serovar Anatum]